MNRLDKLLGTARVLYDGCQGNILCRLPDGTEQPMGLIEAIKKRAQFIRTLDESHDFDELYIAVLNTADEDFSGLEELEGQ